MSISQMRKPRGVRATQEGRQKLQQAKAARRNDKGKPWTYFDVATAAEVDEKTVQRFFRGEAKDRNYAIAIVQALGLEITEIVDPKELNPPVQAYDEIDWRDACGKLLAQQQENQRLRRQVTEQGFELKVYVGLGLVERKQQQRRRGDVPLEEVYQLTEEVITKEYDNDKFLTEVIEPGKSKRIAIIGEPGAGKTTLQEKIGVWIHDKNKGLPICIPLGGLQGRTLKEYLEQKWLKEALQFIEPDASEVEARHIIASLQKQFREGKVWLLLDGVDEMAATSPVQALATIKEQLTDWLVEARVVLTCRLNVWDANVNTMLTGFETYRTLEFKPEQVEDFIRQWFACAKESQRGEELLRKLRETGKERIRELVRNPLRLSLLCQTSYVLPVDEPLPETKAALYERFTRYFYEWKQEQHPTTRTERRQLNQALGELAKAGINGTTRFRLGEDLACDVMGEALFDLGCRLGWLNLVDREAKTEEAVYAFFHPTFQEYFAACGIEDEHWSYFLPREHKDKPVEDKYHPDKYKPYRIFEPQWKEVFLLWLGRDEEELREQKEEFIKMLVGFEDGCGDFYRYRAYFIGAVGVSEFKDCFKVDEIVAQIIQWGFGYFNIDKHGWQTFLDPIAEGARATIPETNRTKAITALVELINHCQNKYTRNSAAKSLINIDPEHSTASTTSDKLINVCHDIFENIIQSIHSEEIYQEEERDIQISDSGKLTEIEKLTQVATLVERIKNCQDEFTCWLAADNLVAIDSGNLNALAALVELINNYQNQTVFSFAVHSLGKVSSGNPTAIAILVELINNSQDSDIRKIAVHSLGKVGSSNPTTITTLVKLIVNSQEQDIRSLAVYNLKENLPQGQIKEVVTTLKDYLSDETYENDSRRYCDCYSVIWHCAQNMTYPDFYQAWHQTTI